MAEVHEAAAESSEDSGERGGGGGAEAAGEGGAREQDRFLPIANVSRIMKKGLPGNAKISKEAKETVQECVSEFISFVTGEASEKCLREKRKTINGDDLLWAIATLGFQDYVEPLHLYLHKFRQVEGERARLQAAAGEPPGPGLPPPSPAPLHLPSYNHIHHHHHHHLDATASSSSSLPPNPHSIHGIAPTPLDLAIPPLPPAYNVQPLHQPPSS